MIRGKELRFWARKNALWICNNKDMMMKFPLLKANELIELHQSLHYLRMPELKALSKRLLLPTDGKKGALIHRIHNYVQTGEIAKLPKIPDISKAKSKQPSPL